MQCVTYYLSRGSTNPEVLVQFLNEILDVCQSVGLHVVASVCDMGTNSVKALKLLGTTGRNQSFKFQNQEISIIYGPPDL
jgi:hypothetical protein